MPPPDGRLPHSRGLLPALRRIQPEPAGLSGRGWKERTYGCTTPQRPAGGHQTRDPRPRQAGDKLRPSAAGVQLRTRAPGPPLLPPVPLPAPRTSNCPRPSGHLLRTLEPEAPRHHPHPPTHAPDPYTQFAPVPGRLGPLGVGPSGLLPSLPGTRESSAGGPGSPVPDGAGNWPGQAEPGRVLAVRRSLPLRGSCHFARLGASTCTDRATLAEAPPPAREAF